MTPEIQWDAGECKAASKRILWYKVPQAYLLSLVWLRIFPLGKFPLALLLSSDLRRFYLSLSCFLPLHRSTSLSHAAPAWWHSEPCWEEPEHLQWANTLQRHRKSCTKDFFFFFSPKIYHMKMAVPGVCEPKSLREDLPSFKFLFEGMRWSGYFKLNCPQHKQHCYSNRDYTKSVPLAHSCSQKYQRDVQPLASVWDRAARLLCSGLHEEDSASTQCSVSWRNTWLP